MEEHLHQFKLDSERHRKGCAFRYAQERQVCRSDCVCIGYTDEWDFRLVKKDNTMNITVKEFEEAFEKMDSNIRPWIGKKNTFKDLDVDIVHTPEEIEPILNPEADKELVDD